MNLGLQKAQVPNNLLLGIVNMGGVARGLGLIAVTGGTAAIAIGVDGTSCGIAYY